LPVRVVWLTNLMWYGEWAPQAELLASCQELLTAIGHATQSRRLPSLYPPLQWDQLLEQKQQVFARFRSIMLPTVWRLVQGDTEAEDELLAQRLVDKQAPGRYVLKGSWSDCAQAVHTDIVLAGNGKVPEHLLKCIADLRTRYHQRCVGLQPFVAGFSDNEFRHWCVAMPDARGQLRFRVAASVRSIYTRTPGVKVQTLSCRNSGPIQQDAALAADLVEELLRDAKYEAWRRDLLTAGCRAVRIDCGITPDRRAFLNELTSPTNTSIFAHAHELELTWWLGRRAAESMQALF